ncbi:MAG: sigma-70 family RNA polymerase sigma factor [Methylotenera sp.]|nr:sigma-70 family RNA polymerase sigma factor [Methylotenera sp.]
MPPVTSLNASAFLMQNVLELKSNSFHLRAPCMGEMYTNNYLWLVGFLNKKLCCQHSAADLAQDTFLKLLHKNNLAEIIEPRAYLTTIAHGLMVSHIRRRELEKTYLAALANIPVAEQPSAESRLITLETLVQLDAMLDGMPPKVRKAYLLLQLEGLSYAQIAHHLGVTTRSVTSYIAKAVLHCAIFKQNLSA